MSTVQSNLIYPVQKALDKWGQINGGKSPLGTFRP